MRWVTSRSRGPLGLGPPCDRKADISRSQGRVGRAVLDIAQFRTRQSTQ
jgi:hypothetical protein